MIAEDTPVIDHLDWLDRMDVHAARGIRDETNLPQQTYTTDSSDENAMAVTVIPAGDGVVIVTDRYEQEDVAWAGRLDDQEILEELVDDGQLDHNA
jgi:hypothetical protein